VPQGKGEVHAHEFLPDVASPFYTIMSFTATPVATLPFNKLELLASLLVSSANPRRDQISGLVSISMSCSLLKDYGEVDLL